jgi:hypothetical protein
MAPTVLAPWAATESGLGLVFQNRTIFTFHIRSSEFTHHRTVIHYARVITLAVHDDSLRSNRLTHASGSSTPCRFPQVDPHFALPSESQSVVPTWQRAQTTPNGTEEHKSETFGTEESSPPQCIPLVRT